MPTSASCSWSASRGAGFGVLGRTLLIPNQEWFPPRMIPHLRRIDHVLAKSRHAQAIFSRHHPSSHFVGFTSADRRITGAAPDPDRFLHVAGGSALKGTSALLEVWARHPEWPELTVVRHPRARDVPLRVQPNVRLVERYLEDDELRALQNACGVHLCPSLSEGWGHYIVEAMSCGAVPLVTDAPPMNELVGPDRGILVPYDRVEPRKLGSCFHVDRGALERAIAALIGMPAAEKERIGAAARRWFEENDRAFATRFDDLLPRLLHDAGPGR
jgi:glycosyltransferase involved in cell wall biosynthesis